jgi:hypothetical protein
LESPEDRIAAASRVLVRVAKVGARALLLVLAVLLLAELALRAIGEKPQDLAVAGLSATVPDSWTGWAMRPGAHAREYVVTNAFGMHEDREVSLAKPPGVRRVAVVGSSVTWGPGQNLADTIPRSAERALKEAGCKAEVLNMAHHGFNILNASAYVQAKAHQFQPDAIVIVMDLQMGFPDFPWPDPVEPEETAVRQLGTLEGWFKRASEYSVALSVIDEPTRLRTWISRVLPLPPPQARPPEALVQRKKRRLRPAETSIAEYEARRRRELGSVVAAVSAFAKADGIPLYFVTPYGPYFLATPQQMAGFSLPALMGPALALYGDRSRAFARETEVQSEVIAASATREGARVIDMLPASRAGTMATGDFSTDGIHMTPPGYHRIGAEIAARLLQDRVCP